MADSAEKTHKATPEKIKQAKSKGSVARTRELGPALAFLAVTAAATTAGAWPWTGPFTGYARSITDAARNDLRGDAVWLLVRDTAVVWLPALMVAFGAAAAGSLLAVFLQGGPEPSAKSLHLDPSRMSPIKKLGQIFSFNALWEHLRALLSAVVAIWIIISALRKISPELPGLALADGTAVASSIASTLIYIGFRASLALALLGVLDLLVSRFLYFRKLRMSTQELKEEMKQQEGRPEVRVARRRRMMELLRARSIQGVKRADVVVTNPTHYAVALSYKRAVMGAPRVIAKGRDQLARRIREEARKHGVPIVENPPLARELYHEVEIDREIPTRLFAAVAAVIAMVLDVRELVGDAEMTEGPA